MYVILKSYDQCGEVTEPLFYTNSFLKAVRYCYQELKSWSPVKIAIYRSLNNFLIDYDHLLVENYVDNYELEHNEFPILIYFNVWEIKELE